MTYDKIKKLEAAVGKSVEQWNAKDLADISLNDETIEILKEQDVLEMLIDLNKEKEIQDILIPVYIKSTIYNAELKGDDLLNNLNNIGKEKILLDEDSKEKEELMKLINSESKYEKMVGYLIAIHKSDLDLQKYETEIKDAIAFMKEKIIEVADISISLCYEVLLDLMEFVFPFRAIYFNLYNVDILDDTNGRLSETLDQIHEFEQEVQKNLQQLVPDIDPSDEIFNMLEEESKKGGDDNE